MIIQFGLKNKIENTSPHIHYFFLRAKRIALKR